MRSLRAVRARVGAWVLLAGAVAVAVGAAVLASGASSGAARPASFAPLLLLTLVLVAVPATELARRRRDEVTLVRVRGGHGIRLVGSVLGESSAAVLVGAVTGLVGGGLALRLLAGRWDVEALVGTDELTTAALVVAVAAVPTVGSAVVVALEPLAASLRRASWSGPGARLRFAGLVLGVAGVLAAALAVYRARADEPGALVLAGPALVGLAAGQLLVWGHRLLGRRAGVASGSSLGVLVGVRRALSPEHAPRLRAVVAAGTVVAASACAVSATDAWADDAARIRNGGPVRIAMPDTAALQTWLLTRELDPDGRWLMAAAVTDQRDEAAFRVAWLDLSRYDRVAADHLEGTPADLADHVEALRDAEPVRLVTGDLLVVRAGSAEVTLHYLDDDGIVSSASTSATTGIDDCAASCVVLGVESPVDAVVSVLRLGDTDLIPAPVDLTAGEVARPDAGTAPEPMLLAGRLDPGDTSVTGIGGEPRGLDVVGESDAVPLLSGAGLVGDLPVGLAAAAGSVPAVEGVVLARDDTPAEVLAALEDAGADPPDDWRPAVEELGARELAEERIGRVTAAAAAALGLIVLLSGRRRRADEDRRQRASLRMVGVTARSLRTAALLEALLVAVVVAATVLAAGWVATAVVVDGVELVRPGPTDLPFGSALSWSLLAATSGAAAVLKGAVR